jgi:hypothetical protein
MPINMGELLPTPPVTQPPARASPGRTATGSTATDRDLEKVPEPVLCHHCGRTATNGISCEGYCVADSNY